MTKAQAFERYGEPFHRGVLDGREIWYYRLKFDEVYGPAFVPFAVSSENVRLGELIFDGRNRVATYTWNRVDVR